MGIGPLYSELLEYSTSTSSLISMPNHQSQVDFITARYVIRIIPTCNGGVTCFNTVTTSIGQTYVITMNN